MIVKKIQEYEFWPDSIAKELVTKWGASKQVVVTGTSMSGDPHIGNSNDVIRGDAIRLAVKSLKQPVELIWVSDDMDPFRSVPSDLPKELEDYLGIPASSIPDFWDCHNSFTVHFEEKFLKQLESVKVEPKVLLGIEMYKSGMYNDVMKKSMEMRREIATIINKYRETPLPDEWYPVDVICEKCGKIATTKILKYYANGEADYFCNPDEILLHRKNPVSGCGNKSRMSILNGNGKLTWRVEWAARWVFLKATCEPFGKEHAAAGGSWDTAKEIVKLFKYKPPFPVVYEHFLVNGEKMSKSKGNVITVDDMLKYMPPEYLRYWMFQGRLTIAKDIKLSAIVPKLFNEFDKAERIFLGQETANDERKDHNYKRAYELAMVKPNKTHVSFPAYEKLVELSKIAPENGKMEFVSRKLKDMGYVPDGVSLLTRMNYIESWRKDFEKQDEVKIKLNVAQKEMIKSLITVVKNVSGADSLQSQSFAVIKESGLNVTDAFKLIYNILLNSDRGPRLGQYIVEIGRDEIIRKLESVL